MPHYYVAGDGAIYQLVDDSAAAWHSGMGTWNDRRQNINRISLGITAERELHGYSDTGLAALAWLVETLRKRYDLPKSAVVRWSDLDPAHGEDAGEGAGRDRHHLPSGVGGVGVAVQEVGADGHEPLLVRPGEAPVDPVDRRVHVAEVGEADAVDPFAVHEGADALQSLSPVDVRVEEDAVSLASREQVEVRDRVRRRDERRDPRPARLGPLPILRHHACVRRYAGHAGRHAIWSRIVPGDDRRDNSELRIPNSELRLRTHHSRLKTQNSELRTSGGYTTTSCRRAKCSSGPTEGRRIPAASAIVFAETCNSAG